MGGLYTGIRTVHIYPTSRMVSDCSGMMVQPHKAIVGANAFSHESGIHQVGAWRQCFSWGHPQTLLVAKQYGTYEQSTLGRWGVWYSCVRALCASYGLPVRVNECVWACMACSVIAEDHRERNCPC